MNWHELRFPEDVDPFDDADKFIRHAEEIYRDVGSPADFCVFQEYNEESSRVFYFSPAATRHCRDNGLFLTYRKAHACEKPTRSSKPIITVVGDNLFCQRMLDEGGS